MSRASVLLALLLGLAGCGGGIFFGVGVDVGDDDDGDGFAPSVLLAVSPPSAAAGSAVTLVAAATDGDGIDSVAFIRIDAGEVETTLDTDGTAPYELTTTLPAIATGSVRYLARATDGSGVRGTSAVVSVTIR